MSLNGYALPCRASTWLVMFSVQHLLMHFYDGVLKCVVSLDRIESGQGKPQR